MVILLTGPDTYRSQRRFEQLRDAFRAKHDESGINTVLLDGQTATAEELRAAVQTQGFFSTKRFVGINRWAPTGPLAAADVQEITDPFADSREVIVTVRSEGDVKRKTRTKSRVTSGASTRLARATVETFELLTDGQRRKWISDEVKRRSGRIEPAAIEALARRSSSDLWRVHHSLDQLLAYAGNRAVTELDVATLVSAPEVTDMFALTDAVGHQQPGVALRLLEREIGAGTHPLAIVSLLANHVATLRSVQRVSGQVAPAGIASRLGIHPYVVKKALEQSRRFSPERLSAWHHRLVQIDMTLKQSPLDAATLLDLLITGT
jgi:DNA polymerase-3 subunit delta